MRLVEDDRCIIKRVLKIDEWSLLSHAVLWFLWVEFSTVNSVRVDNWIGDFSLISSID